MQNCSSKLRQNYSCYISDSNRAWQKKTQNTLWTDFVSGQLTSTCCIPRNHAKNKDKKTAIWERGEKMREGENLRKGERERGGDEKREN